ncbi:hypothetical protein [Pleomorphomonas koreensis]|uniref:hypothetical protein n=1 Tax=Pleomorphomonas koreensis TaxID=257440 RepID=UPI00041DB23E|nr:hypothetical protein [Pleomorphomonas koreensis]
MTLFAEVRDIGDLVTDPVTGFRAPEGGSNRDWWRRFDQIQDLRRRAIDTNAHHITVLIDTIVIYANAHGDAPRDGWRVAYAAIREAIICERGAT